MKFPYLKHRISEIRNPKSEIRSGFTLIELLVVISIIGILVTIMTISYYDAQKRGRDSKRVQDLETIKKALQLYYNDNGKFPATANAWIYSIDGTSWIPGLTPTYIRALPLDPLNKNESGASSACGWPPNANCYEYAYYSSDGFCSANSTGQYILTAKLEGTKSLSTHRMYVDANGNACYDWPTSDPTVYPNQYVTGE